MNEVTITKLLAIIAVIFVTAALVTLPYQNQVANAAPAAKKYQVYVTLTGVPANAEDLIMNVTIIRMPFFVEVSDTQIKTVTSPTEGETLKFVLSVPAGSNENAVLVCGNTADFRLSSCQDDPLPSKGGGPIRVDYTYPTCIICTSSGTTALATEPGTEEEQALTTDEEVATEEEATDEAATDEAEAAPTTEEEEEQALTTDEGDTTTADSAEQPTQQSNEDAPEEDTGGGSGQGPPDGGGDDGGGGRPLPDDSGGSGDDSGEGNS